MKGSEKETKQNIRYMCNMVRDDEFVLTLCVHGDCIVLNISSLKVCSGQLVADGLIS